MTYADFDVLDASKKDFPNEYSEYEKFLLTYRGFKSLDEATKWVESWKSKSDGGTSGTSQNLDKDPQNTKCKYYFAENLKDYSNDNKNKAYLGDLSSKLFQDGQRYSKGSFNETEKYMSFSQYKCRFQGVGWDYVDNDELVERLEQAKFGYR